MQAAGWRTWSTAAGLYIFGGAAASAASGLVLGSAGLAMRLLWGVPPLAAVVVPLAALALLDSEVTRLRVPQLSRQTPVWFTCSFGPIWSAGLWGVDLGFGWTTRSCFATYIAAALLVVWIGSPWFGALALVCYGLGRGAGMVAAGITASVRPLDSVQAALASHYMAVRTLNTAVLIWCACFIAVGALR